MRPGVPYVPEVVAHVIDIMVRLTSGIIPNFNHMCSIQKKTLPGLLDDLPRRRCDGRHTREAVLVRFFLDDTGFKIPLRL